MKKKEGKSTKRAVHFVVLKSIADMARNVAGFGDGMRPVFSFKQGDSHRVFVPMGKLGDTRLMFCVDVKKSGNYIVYQPRTLTESEMVEIKDNVSLQQNRNIQNVPIIELGKNPFEGKEGKPKVHCIMVKDHSALIKGVVAHSIEHETMGKVYVFRYKSESYVGSFMLIDDEDTRSFCYAKMKLEKDFSFFRYNYNTDKVEATDLFGEHSYLYVRIINLKEPFSFFKPE